MSEVRPVSLVLVPPGKRRSFVTLIENLGNRAHDIDSVLCEKLKAANLRKAITENPRNTLEAAWKETIKDICTVISYEKKPYQNTLLVGHVLYYKDSTRKIFSVFDTGYLKDTVFYSRYVERIAKNRSRRTVSRETSISTMNDRHLMCKYKNHIGF